MRITVIVLGVLVVVAAIVRLLPGNHTPGERSIPDNLKTIAAAEADFRANDRDKDGRTDYWRGDVASLYTMIPKGGTERDRIRLIEFSTAAADDRPLVHVVSILPREPKNGYWFRAILKKGEPPVLAGSQFAFCAVPADYPKSGRWTYLLDETLTIFKSDLGHGRGIEEFPDAAELQKSWSKAD